jgi:hypothetical protein
MAILAQDVGDGLPNLGIVVDQQDLDPAAQARACLRRPLWPLPRRSIAAERGR